MSTPATRERGTGEGSGGLTLFFLFTIAVHIIDLTYRLRTGSGVSVWNPVFFFLHVIIVPLLALLLMKETRTKQDFTVICAWALGAYFIPILMTIVQPLLDLLAGKAIYSLLTIFTPIWAIYAITTDIQKQKFLNWIVWIYEIVWIVIVVVILSKSIFATGDINLGILSPQKSIGDATQELLIAVREGAAKTYTSIRSTISQTDQEVKGNLTRNVAQQLSPADFETYVKWEKPYAYVTPLTIDRDVVITTKLQTKTFSEQEPLRIALSCTTTGTTPDRVTLSPGTELEVYGPGVDMNKYDCTIQRGALLPGEHTIQFTASYNGESVSRLEITAGKENNFEWTSIGTLAPKPEMRAVLQDAQNTYAMTPLKITIAAPEKYIVLKDKLSETKFEPELRLERTLSEGDVLVEEIVLIVPKQLRITGVPPFIKEEITKSQCSHVKNNYLQAIAPCDDATDAVLILTPQAPINVTQLTRVGTRMITQQSDQEKFLEGGAYARKTITTLAKYSHTTTVKERFKVEGEQQQTTQPQLNIPYITSGPNIITVQSGARISFTTNVAVRGTLEYYPVGAQSRSQIMPFSYRTTQLLDISQLQPATKYQAIIKYQDRENRENEEVIQEFETKALPGVTS